MEHSVHVAAQPVLVVLVNNHEDWRRICEEHWYRIPLRSTPLPVAAEFLAFYQTRVFGPEAWQISYYAPVQTYRIVARRDVLPDEPNHARADDLYYRIEIGPIQRLARPIPSRRLRRVTFIPTTSTQLFHAADVADLWLRDDSSAIVWMYFRDAAIKATKRLLLEEKRALFDAHTIR